nr:hypothetical protein [Candidatus Njordarchaeum guaymaensis]
MTRFRQRNVNSPVKKSCIGFLVLMIVGSAMLGCLITTETHYSPPTVLADPNANDKAPSCDFLDPDAYLNGFHLYNVTKWNTTSEGAYLNLSYPVNWNVTALGLNFFNGTLQQTIVENTTTVTAWVTQEAGSGYQGSITNLKIPGNSTVYQAQFNITGLKVGETSLWSTVNGLSNSSYPMIDGNVGIAQRFFISNHARNLTIQVRLMRIEGTVRNLTVEVRSSTFDNRVGGFIKAASYAPTAIGTGSTWVTLAIPSVNLNPGYYFIVLHTDSWLRSGGGYQAETTLSGHAISPSSGWVSFDRGVNWDNLVNLTSISSYYFNGFKLKVHVVPPPTPSDLNLRIADFQVADNFIWNQSVWSSAPSHSFKITSDYPIPVLNFTYKVWVYTYGSNNLFNKLYKIQVQNCYKNTTAVIQNRNFTMMYVNLVQADLLNPGVINSSTSTVTLKLRLFLNNTAVGGTLNVTANAQLTTRRLGISFTGPYSLKLAFNYTHSGGLYNNVTLAETALTIGPINNLIDNVYINGSMVSRSRWSYNSNESWLYISREAFTILPQFTLLNGSFFNCTVVTFNDFTASVSTIVKGSVDTTPIGSVQVVNSTPLVDLEGVRQVNITVTAPNGTLINSSNLTVIGGLYKFNWTLDSGAGIYGLKVISVCNGSGNVTTRWIGAATVNDFVLAPPNIILARVNGTILTGNLTSGRTILILANISYVNHPEFAFSGIVNITIYLGTTGEVDRLPATWNATTKTFDATYVPPSVDSPIPLTIYVEAVDLKGRISANSTFTYLLPHSTTDIPQGQPSIVGILELLVIGLILLIPVVAYVVEKRRRT